MDQPLPVNNHEPTKIKNDIIETRYTGIKKKGATSYMNTLIQLLFSIQSFRKVVYEAPTEGKKPTQNTLLALQRIFHRLQALDECVSTSELTRSLGWGDMDALFPRDIVDFRRTLLSTMQGTKADDPINKLLSGELKTFIKCFDIGKEYSVVESFDIIQLEVNGVKTLRDSFMKFTELENLTGKNRYLDPNYGLQEAEKGRIFQSFPPILFLQLQRWQHNVQKDAMVKSNSPVEFPFNIDLDEFLGEGADRSQPWVYSLHAVSMHSGDLTHGHNYAFIKPEQESEWLKFDDDSVTQATKQDIINTYRIPATNAGNDILSSAYVLVYIRDPSCNEVGKHHGVEEVHSVKAQVPQTETRTEDNHPQPIPVEKLSVKVVTDQMFHVHDGFDITAFDDKMERASSPVLFQVPRNGTYSSLKTSIACHFRFQPGTQFQLWAFIKRINGTFRPYKAIDESKEGLTMETVHQDWKINNGKELRLYVDVIPAFGIKRDPEFIMLFLKHFDPLTQTLRGVGKVHIPKDASVTDLTSIIRTLMQWEIGTSMTLYEEINPWMIEILKPRLTMEKSDLENGDIICFQAHLACEEKKDLQKKGFYTNAKKYYNFLHNQVTPKTTLKRKRADSDEMGCESTASVSRTS